jgi:predicted ATP-grasp superfamily ATP-dependent carboligase
MTGDGRAVVMGLGATGLGVARALFQEGVQVVAADVMRTPGAWSRALRFVPRPALGDDAAACDFYVRLAASSGDRPVLFPVAEADVGFIARHRELLEEHYRFLIPETATVERAVSKGGHIAWAEELGLPMPRTVAASDPCGVERACRALRFPVVVKPDSPDSWRSGAGAAALGGAKALPVDSPEALRRLYERVASVDPRIVIQEMVVGGDPAHFSYHVLVGADGVTRGEFIGQKMRLAPPHFGVGTFVRSVRDDEILEAGRDVVRRLGYRGVANVQFKRDARDGRPVLLELNPRFSLWVSLGVACGVNLPHLYWKTCMRQPMGGPPGWTSGTTWQHLLWDLRSMRTYARDGSVSWPQFARSLGGRRVGALFNPSDPLPGLVAACRAVRAHASA